MKALKTFILTGLLLGAVAVQAAAAQAEGPAWYAEKEGKLELLGETPVETATLAVGETNVAPEFTVKLSNKFVLGPCAFSKTTAAWNNAKTIGQSKISNWTFSTPCDTSDPACKVTAATLTTKGLTGSLIWVDNSVPAEAIGNANNPVSITYTVGGGTCLKVWGQYVVTSSSSVTARSTGKGCYTFAGLVSITNTAPLIGSVEGQECRSRAGETIIPK